ncbi:hypothetical protein ABIF70_011048, partial [Bradyrhizobium japonicum]
TTMKLDRNLNADGRGKYGLVLNRKIKEIEEKYGTAAGTAGFAVREALKTLASFGVTDWGDTTETEFFLIRLKDTYAGGALHTYASYAVRDGQVEYGREAMEMAKRSGEFHPNCKKPD